MNNVKKISNSIIFALLISGIFAQGSRDLTGTSVSANAYRVEGDNHTTVQLAVNIVSPDLNYADGVRFDFGESNFTVSATCGVINQQGRPFMHGYEIHLEDATVHFEFAAYSDHPEAAPLKVLVSDGTVVRPELPTGDDVAGFVGEIQEVQRCIVEDTDSAILGGELARDAILLAERQTESVCGGRIVSI